MYCNRLHTWWSTQSRLATLLSSLIARPWVGLQTLWWFQLKDLSIDEMVGAWCFGCLSGPPGFTCWISFAPVFSFIYCWVLIFALSPCYICCFVALRPKSTAMVIAGRSVHLTTLFPGQAWTSGYLVLCAHTFACNWQQPFLNDSAEGRRMNEIVYHESMGPGRDRTRDPWISSQTRICISLLYLDLYVLGDDALIS